MKFDVHNYDDIINIDKPKSNHKPMDKLQRASQFAPFAALKGYEESIFESGRIVDEKIELSQEQKDDISYKLIYLQENIKMNILIKIIYFVPDKNKIGGFYQNKIGILKKIDSIKRIIEFVDKTKIDIYNLYSLDFDEYEKK